MISNDDLLSWILPPGGGGLSPQKLRKDIKVEKYPDRKTINPPNIIFTPVMVRKPIVRFNRGIYYRY